MDSTGFSSPRPECFPAGLRVLVVDDDPTWLKILEKMLKKCNYEVTTCNLARDALDLLRERKDGFDIVISDVNMPDMDGFKLLEHVGLEMDLPVIMMSVDGETSRVMKGVQHGACDYLLKPIRMKELRNIWQHVFRKRIHEVRDIEGYESLEEIQMMRNAAEMSDDSFLFSGDFVSGKKRKDAENKHNDGESSSGKKARVVWTVELHQKFVKAVNQIGFDKVGPKKILDLMGVPWLTRENVASHLQKYRLYLTRLQKESELKATFGGTKHSDITSKELPVNVCLHNSITKNATALPPNILADENYAVSGQKIPVLHDEPKLCETNTKVAALPMSMADSKSSTSRISYDHRSFGPLDSDVKPEPKIQPHYSWSTPTLQFKQEHKTRFQENGLDHLPRPIHHIQISPVKTSLVHNTGLPNNDSGKPTQAGLNPSFDKSNIDKLAKAESTTSLFPVQPESLHAAIDPIPSPYDVPEYSQRNLTASTGPAIRLWDEGFFDYSSQVEFYPPNPYPGSLDPLGYANQDLIADVPLHLYDTLRFESEFAGDMVEYPVIDQGVFIA